MSGPDVTFTPSNAKAEAGKDPWKRTNDFTTEIDPGEMLATSREFANAGGEAGYAGELAVSASEETADAAEVGGQKMHDIEAHVAETSNLLQGDGEALFGVAEKLGTVVELAEESIDFVEARIEQLDEDLPALSDEGQTEMDNFATEIWTEYLKTVNDLPEGVELEKLPVVVLVSYGGEEYRALNGVVPSDLADAVAEYWLERGATAVKNADTAIEEALDEYHASLTKISSDLGEYGYTGTGSPVSIFHTEMMAEYQAERVREALDNEPPNYVVIEEATRFLSDLVERVEQGSGAQLSDHERDFLWAFYGNLDAETLGDLGHLDLGVGPVRPEVDAIKEALGGGILLLTNPDVFENGYPNDGGAVVNLPNSVREILFDIEVGVENLPGRDAPFDYDPETGQLLLSGTRDFQGLSALLQASSLAPGTEFAGVLGDAAIRMQQQVNPFLDDPAAEVMLNIHWADHSLLATFDTGSSGMLDVLSRNLEGSQDFLLDEQNLEWVMGVDWRDHPDGAVSLIEVATERVQDTPQSAENAARIAQSAFEKVGDDPASWRELVPKGGAMNDALVDLGSRYIDAFTSSQQDAGIPVGADGVDVVDGQYFASFRLPGREEEGLGFLDFVANMGRDATPADHLLDSDMIQLHAAGQAFFGAEAAESHRLGDGVSTFQDAAGRLFGNLTYADVTGIADSAKAQYDLELLVHQRQQIVTNTLMDLGISHPVARGINAVTKGIDGEEVKEFTKKTLTALAGHAETATKSQITDWVDETFAGKPDEDSVGDALLNAREQVYANGRFNANYQFAQDLLVVELQKTDSEVVDAVVGSNEYMGDIFVYSDDPGPDGGNPEVIGLKPKGQLDSDEDRDAVNLLLKEMDVDSWTGWGTAQDLIETLDGYKAEPPEVNDEYVDGVRKGNEW